MQNLRKGRGVWAWIWELIKSWESKIFNTVHSNILYKEMIFFVYNILSVLIRPEQTDKPKN